MRSLAGSIRGDGNFMLAGTRYPFRVSSGQTPDGNGTRVHLNIDPGQRALAADLEGVLAFDARAPRFEGAVTLATPAGQKDATQPPWRIAARVKADYAAARLDQIEVNYGAEERALRLAGNGDIRFGASPLAARVAVGAAARRRPVCRQDDNDAEPVRVVPALRALLSGIPHAADTGADRARHRADHAGRPPAAGYRCRTARRRASPGRVRRLEFRAPGATRVSLSGASAQGAPPDSFKAALNVESADPDALMTWLQGRSDIAYRSQKPLRLRGDVTSRRAALPSMP